MWNFFNRFIKKKTEEIFPELTQNKRCFGTWNCFSQEEISCIDKIACHDLFRRNLNIFLNNRKEV